MNANIYTQRSNLAVAKISVLSFFSSSKNMIHVYTTVRERSVMLNQHVSR